MKSYIKMEIFAYDLFNSVWFKGGLISHKYDASQIYKDECMEDSDFEVVSDKIFYDAVLCRRILFKRIYMEEIAKEKNKYWNSVSDFYEYIQSTCNRYDWFGCLRVFERIFATCAFVINLCFHNRENKNIDIIKIGHIFWAKYFEAFTTEFYKQGGWNQLKIAASYYSLPFIFLQMCLQDSKNALPEVAEAVENYTNLQQTYFMYEFKTVCKLWIKSRIKNLQRSNNNSVEFSACQSCLYAEYILKELKSLCSPNALEFLEYDKECSERTIFDSDSFYIPLTPTESPKSMHERNSSSSSFDGIDISKIHSEDILSTSPPEDSETFSEVETGDNDFVNQSHTNDIEVMINSNYFDDSNFDIFKQPFAFESICIISDYEQDEYIFRSTTKMCLNHETLKLEETAISETDFCSNENDNYSVGEDLGLNTKGQILAPQEVMNKQCPRIEDSSGTVQSNLNDSLMNSLYVNESNPSHNNCFNESDIKKGYIFSNAVVSHNNEKSISLSEWDENDLSKNVSTPIKQINNELSYNKKLTIGP